MVSLLLRNNWQQTASGAGAGAWGVSFFFRDLTQKHTHVPADGPAPMYIQEQQVDSVGGDMSLGGKVVRRGKN